MVNESVLQGHWEEVRGKLQEKWGELTQDDVAQFNGNVEQLVGKIHRKTGASREAVEEYLDSVTNECATEVEKARAAATEYVQSSKQAMRDSYDYASESMRAGMHDAETLVQQRPAEAVVTAFGVGLVVGVIVGVLIRR